MPEKTLFGHPKGLSILFFTELWERFSYYGMRAILVLFLTAKTMDTNAGWGWDNATALELYGWYTMMVYLMAVPGGWIADRWLGQKKTVLLGGILLSLGHVVLAFNTPFTFYSGLILVVLGVGALKPNISTMVGGLYPKGDPRRDSAFTIFYIGINIGAFSAPLLVGYIGETINWHYGFGLAGLGMIAGLLTYLWGLQYLKGIGEIAPLRKRVEKHEKVALTKVEKDRMFVLLLSFLIVIVFWGAYEQAGGLMNLYAKEKINRLIGHIEIPASFFQALPALYVIIFGVPVAWFWNRWRQKGHDASSLFKMGTGTIVMGFGFLLLAGAAIQTTHTISDKASMIWMLGAYLMHVLGELSLSPVALSFITKMVPLRYASFMMGAYFFATGLGSKLAGMIGSYAQQAGELQIFTGIFIFTFLFGLLVLLFVKKLNKLTHHAEDVNPALDTG